MKAQVTIIQTELEKTLAKAALAYVDVEVREAIDPAVRMHALSEGLGFVYALRFCKSQYGVDSAWSDGVVNQLLSGPEAAWSVDNAKLDAAASAIRAKFSL